MIPHGVDAIEGEREEGLLQLHRIGLDRELFRCGFGDHFNAPGNRASQDLGGVLHNGIQVEIRPFAGAGEMQLLKALDELSGLLRVAFDEGQAFTEGMIRFQLAEIGVTEAMHPGDDVVDVVRITGSETGQRFSPVGGFQAVRCMGKRRFILPKPFVALDDAGLAAHRSANFADMSNSAGRRVTKSKAACERGSRGFRVFQMLPDPLGIRFMNALQKLGGILLPGLDGNAGPQFDARAHEGELEIGGLPKQNSGAVLQEKLDWGFHAATARDYLFSAAKVSTTH